MEREINEEPFHLGRILVVYSQQRMARVAIFWGNPNYQKLVASFILKGYYFQ